jgi:hypothetical protein
MIAGTPRPLQLGEQVRPDLGLHHQRERRVEVVEEVAHRAGQVVGQVHVQHRIAPQGAHAGRTGWRGGGHQQRPLRVRGAQRVDQRDRGVDFAHRDRVQPQAVGDRFAAVEREALAPAVEILALAQAAPDQVVQRKRQRDPDDQRIQRAQRAVAERLMHGGRIAQAVPTLESAGERNRRRAPAVAAHLACVGRDRLRLDRRPMAVGAGARHGAMAGEPDARWP